MSDDEERDELEDENYQLMMSIARGVPLKQQDRRNAVHKDKLRDYSPIYKHPLPMSENWAHFQAVLHRVMSCKLDDQCRAAVTLNNAWVLEDAFMAGAPADIQDVNGFAPIHIACQQNSYECLMVLLNIGVDINIPTVSGLTPLYMAHAASSTQCYKLLLEHNAKLVHELQLQLKGATVLDPPSNARRHYDDHY